MRTLKRGQHPRPKPPHANDLSSLKQLRAAALQATQTLPEALAPSPTQPRDRHAATQTRNAIPANKSPAAAATLDAADINLFRRAMITVTPMPKQYRAPASPTPAASRGMLAQRRLHASGSSPPVPAQVSDHFMAAHGEQDDRSFVRSRHSGDLIKGLRRGKWPVQASVDLHGSTLDDARERLDRFLHSCLEHRIRCVRIVHGKGYGSRNGMPVLKDVVRRWLTQWAAVQAYAECAERDGGAGAVQVLLVVRDGPEPHRN